MREATHRSDRTHFKGVSVEPSREGRKDPVSCGKEGFALFPSRILPAPPSVWDGDQEIVCRLWFPKGFVVRWGGRGWGAGAGMTLPGLLQPCLGDPGCREPRPRQTSPSLQAAAPRLLAHLSASRTCPVLRLVGVLKELSTSKLGRVVVTEFEYLS